MSLYITCALTDPTYEAQRDLVINSSPHLCHVTTSGGTVHAMFSYALQALLSNFKCAARPAYREDVSCLSSCGLAAASACK